MWTASEGGGGFNSTSQRSSMLAVVFLVIVGIQWSVCYTYVHTRLELTIARVWLTILDVKRHRFSLFGAPRPHINSLPADHNTYRSTGNLKTNTLILLLLSLSVCLRYHDHASTAFQPVVPLNQKIGTTHLSTIRLQSSIHWPWHHDGMPKHGSHLLHEGVTAKFMPKWPAIVTYTLVKGWTDETTKAFQEAVDKVIDLNPILTWRVYRHRPFPIFHPPGDHFELRADMDSYSKENHDLSLSSTNVTRSSPKNMNCTSGLNFMETNIIPSLDIFTVNQREPKFARNCHSLVPTWSSCLTTTHVLWSRWVTVLEMESPSVETVTEMVWWICIKCDTCLAHPCHCSLAS
jgi:hypothetical protein